MRSPDHLTVQQMVDWHPPRGILSVFVDLDPANRSAPWRLELKDALDKIATTHQDAATKATIQRVADRFPGRGPIKMDGRYQLGFVEVSEKRAREDWFELQMPAVRTAAFCGDRPHIAPLLKVIDQAALTGVVAISAERVEIYEWSFGLVELLAESDIEFLDPGHEVKSPKVDPARGTHVSSSGRDHFEQRKLEHRNHFLDRCLEDVRRLSGERAWRNAICFGDEALFRVLTRHASASEELRHVSSEDLIGSPAHVIAQKASDWLAKAEDKRETTLVQRAKDAALTHKGRGVLGAQATLDCLAAGRVDHLLYDPEREFADALTVGHQTFVGDGMIRRDGPALTERVLHRALETGATITPLAGGPAAALAEHDGMAALLRY